MTQIANGRSNSARPSSSKCTAHPFVIIVCRSLAPRHCSHPTLFDAVVLFPIAQLWPSECERLLGLKGSSGCLFSKAHCYCTKLTYYNPVAQPHWRRSTPTTLRFHVPTTPVLFPIRTMRTMRTMRTIRTRMTRRTMRMMAMRLRILTQKNRRKVLIIITIHVYSAHLYICMHDCNFLVRNIALLPFGFTCPLVCSLLLQRNWRKLRTITQPS